MKKQILFFLIVISTLPIAAQTQNGMLTRILGGGPNSGFAFFGGLSQNFSEGGYMCGIDVDSYGNLYYLIHYSGVFVNKISVNGSNLSEVNFWGNFVDLAQDIYIDNNNDLYVSLAGNNSISKLGLATSQNPGNIGAVAGEPYPYSPNSLFATLPFAGDGGLATNAKLYFPQCVKKDLAGNLYISDNGHKRIRKVNAQTGIINTIAGGGTSMADGVAATAADLRLGFGFCIDKYNNIYIADSAKIRKIDGQSGTITTIAGTGIYGYTGDNGNALNARINPGDIEIDSSGNIYFTEPANGCIRKIDAGTHIIHTIVGNGSMAMGYNAPMEMPAIIAKFYHIGYMCIDRKGDIYFTAKIDTTSSYDAYIYKLSYHKPAAGASDSLAVYIYDSCSGSTSNIISQHYNIGDSIKTYFGDGNTGTYAMIPANGQGYVNVVHAYDFPGSYRVKQVLYNGGMIKDSVSYNYTHQMCATIPLQFFYDANGNCAYDTATDAANFFPLLVAVDSNAVPIDTISVTSTMYYNVRGNNNDIYTFRLINSPGNLQMQCPAGGVRYDTLHPLLNYHPPLTFAFSCPVPGNSYDLSLTTSTQTGRHLQNGTIMVNNSYCNSQNGVLTMHFSPKYEYCDAIPAPTSISGQTLIWNLNGLSSTQEQPVIHYSICKSTTDMSSWLASGDTVHTDITLSPTTSDVNVANNHCIRTDTVKSSYDPNEMNVQPQGVIPEGTTLEYTIEFENTGNDTAHNIYVMDTLSPNVDMKSLRIVSASHKMSISSYHDSLQIVKFDFPNIKLADSSHHNQCTGIFRFTITAKTGLPNATDIGNRAGIYFDDNPVVMTNEVHNLVCSYIPVPQAVISVSPSNTLCSGNTVLFTASLSNQGSSPSYKWMVNGGIAGTNNSYSYTPSNNDSVWLTMSSNAICAVPQTVNSSTIHMNLTTTQTPIISMNGPDSLCAGMYGTYATTTNIAGSSYRWYVNETITGTDSNSYRYMPADGDLIRCVVSCPAGICVTTDTVSTSTIPVRVQDYIKPVVAIAGRTIVQQGDTVIYTAVSNVEGAKYVWIVNRKQVGDSSATLAYEPMVASTINCVLYVPHNGGCYTQDSVVSNVLTIDALEGTARVYPNPASEYLTIEAEPGAYTYYTIINSMGEIVSTEALDNFKTTLYLGGMERGVYCLKLTGRHDTKVIRVVKE